MSNGSHRPRTSTKSADLETLLLNISSNLSLLLQFCSNWMTAAVFKEISGELLMFLARRRLAVVSAANLASHFWIRIACPATRVRAPLEDDIETTRNGMLNPFFVKFGRKRLLYGVRGSELELCLIDKPT